MTYHSIGDNTCFFNSHVFRLKTEIYYNIVEQAGYFHCSIITAILKGRVIKCNLKSIWAIVKSTKRFKVYDLF